MKITIDPGLPYFGSLFDCRYHEARTVARNHYTGEELEAHLEAIQQAEEDAAEEASK